MDAAELFFDGDPGTGNGIALPISGNGTVYDTTVTLPPLDRGIHTLHVRNRSGSVWTSPLSQVVRVRSSFPGDSVVIAQAEIFFGSDPGAGNGCQLAADDGAFDQRQEDAHRFVSASFFSLGQHLVYGRVRDTSGEWSALPQDTFSVIEPHIFAVAEVDTIGTQVRVFWSKYPAATEYHLHYDSVSTGTFTQYYTVTAPDTSVLLETAPRRFFRVVAIQPDADGPCPPAAASALSQQTNSQFTRP